MDNVMAFIPIDELEEGKSSTFIPIDQLPDSEQSNVAVEEQPVEQSQEQPQKPQSFLESQVNVSGLKSVNDYQKDVASGKIRGLIKTGANLLDFEQKLLDISAKGIKQSIDLNIGPLKDVGLVDRILKTNIKSSLTNIRNNVYGDMATQAREAADQIFSKPKTAVGKLYETLIPASGFVTEMAVTGGVAPGIDKLKLLGPASNKMGMLGKILTFKKEAQTLAAVGAVQGSENGDVGANSAKQAGLNLAMGKMFGAISKLTPGPEASNALKSFAWTAKNVLAGGVGGATSLVSNGDLYSHDPVAVERFMDDFTAGFILQALPNGNPRKIAERTKGYLDAKEKLSNELLGNVKSGLDKNATLDMTEYYQTERPATKMLDEIVAKRGPAKDYRDLIDKTELELKDTQMEKATILNNSTKNIQGDPTIGLQSVKISEAQKPGSTTAAVEKYQEIINNEKEVMKKYGKNMSVLDAFKRTSELKFELNDDAMKAQNRVPLTPLQKNANETLIGDYNRLIKQEVSEYAKLGMKESALITAKTLMSGRSAAEQTSPTESFKSAREFLKSSQYRASGPGQSLIGTVHNLIKNVILKGSPVEMMTKEIASIQKKLDKLATYEAKKVIADEKVSNFGKEIMKSTANFSTSGEAKNVPDVGEIIMGKDQRALPPGTTKPPLQIGGVNEPLQLSGPSSQGIESNIQGQRAIPTERMNQRIIGGKPPLIQIGRETGFTMKKPNSDYIQERIKEVGRGARAESKLKVKKLKYVYEKGE